TGDISKVQAQTHRREETWKPAAPVVRQALQRVASFRQGAAPTAPDAALLNKAGVELGKAAVQQPGRYLKALQDLRRLAAEIREKKRLCSDCLTRVEAALHQFLPVFEKTARKPVSPGPEKTLSSDYFNRLD